MSRLTRDGTAGPVSREQILRHVRGQGNINFPCSADHEQDWQPFPVDPYSAICGIWQNTQTLGCRKRHVDVAFLATSGCDTAKSSLTSRVHPYHHRVVTYNSVISSGKTTVSVLSSVLAVCRIGSPLQVSTGLISAIKVRHAKRGSACFCILVLEQTSVLIYILI